MNWQLVCDTTWSSARAQQWACAAMVSKRNIRLRTDDIMTKLRGAYNMLSFLRHFRPDKARQLRKEYGYSRFYDLYKEWIRYELSPDECIEYLESDLSNAAMVMQVVDMHDPREEWERNAVTIYGKVAKLVQVSYDAPEWFREWAGYTEKLFKEQGIQ